MEPAPPGPVEHNRQHAVSLAFLLVQEEYHRVAHRRFTEYQRLQRLRREGYQPDLHDLRARHRRGRPHDQCSQSGPADMRFPSTERLQHR